MARISIFGTERPDLGTLIKFDTPGQNETQLDEDLFEKEIIKFFEANKFLSDKRIANITGKNLGSADLIDYFCAVGRSFELMNQLPSEEYFKTHSGYVKK